MKASRSLIPGGWLYFWGKPPQQAGSTGHRLVLPSSVSPLGFRSWLLIGGVILMLAVRPAGGAEAALSTLVDDGGLPVDEFSRVFHTKDAPSDAQVLQRIQNSAGLWSTFSLTRNPDPRSAGSDITCELLMAGAPRGFLSQLSLGDNGLVVFVAGTVGRHFEKLSTWSGQSGAGVIYPFNSKVGLFVDARRSTPHSTRYYGVARAGLRILY